MTNIIKEGNWSQNLSSILDQSLKSAEENTHKLSQEVLGMTGMSGTRYRMLINKLVELMPNPRYLEIGSWTGSTACAAGYKNSAKIVCIDNWYEGDSIKNSFIKNINTFLSEQNVSFKHSDFRNIDYTTLGKFNIYMFDGPHDKQDQYDGIKLALPALEDEYVLIVDDYNDAQVQEGTENALKELNQTVIASVKILTGNNPYLRRTDWHNGYYIAVIKKDNK